MISLAYSHSTKCSISLIYHPDTTDPFAQQYHGTQVLPHPQRKEKKNIVPVWRNKSFRCWNIMRSRRRVLSTGSCLKLKVAWQLPISLYHWQSDRLERRDAGVPYTTVNAYVIVIVTAEARSSCYHKPQYGGMTWPFQPQTGRRWGVLSLAAYRQFWEQQNLRICRFY
jgi:hypothetical protein